VPACGCRSATQPLHRREGTPNGFEGSRAVPGRDPRRRISPFWIGSTIRRPGGQQAGGLVDTIAGMSPRWIGEAGQASIKVIGAIVCVVIFIAVVVVIILEIQNPPPGPPPPTGGLGSPERHVEALSMTSTAASAGSVLAGYRVPLVAPSPSSRRPCAGCGAALPPQSGPGRPRVVSPAVTPTTPT
jgi:hypothetical protein